MQAKAYHLNQSATAIAIFWLQYVIITRQFTVFSWRQCILDKRKYPVTSHSSLHSEWYEKQTTGWDTVYTFFEQTISLWNLKTTVKYKYTDQEHNSVND